MTYKIYGTDRVDICPKCGSDNLVSMGEKYMDNGEKRYFLCNNCNAESEQEWVIEMLSNETVCPEGACETDDHEFVWNAFENEE